jgi:large subunit ribosomal protein L13
MMKTSWKTKTDIKRDWYEVDVAGKTLGRSATQIAELLIGKSKVDRVPNMDCGDYVIVVNASKIEVTGNKGRKKIYYHHTGYPGGLRSKTFEDMKKRRPTRLIELAVKNMLPKNKLRQTMMTRLFVYADSEHSHKAQKPKKFELKY